MSHQSIRCRMKRSAFAALLLGATSLAGPVMARADSITPDQARALETSIHQWLADTVGPHVTLPPRPVEVTADGDHYDLSIPFAVLLGSAGTPAAGAGAVTAALKPVDGGKWALDNLTFPSPGHFAFDVGSADKKVPVEVDLTLASQDMHALFDPSFATASTMHSAIGATDVHISSPLQNQTQHFDSTTGEAAMTPTSAGRVDVTENVMAKGMSVQAQSSDDHAMKLSAENLSVAGHLDDVDRLKVLAALQALVRMGGDITTALQPSAAATPPPTLPGKHHDAPAQAAADTNAAAQAVVKSAMRNMMTILTDVASGGEVDEKLDNVKLSIDGHDGSAEHATIGVGAAAPSGMLQAHLEMGIDGLGLAELPPMMASYVPKHLKLRPFVGGISMAVVSRMVMDATDPSKPGATPDPSAFFAQGGITFGLEDLLIDLGDTALTGTAKLVATTPQQISGKAQLIVSHFDVLMQRVQQDPMLQQGFPVMVMLRGLGKPDGDKTVWNIEVADNDVTVNGTDLSAMMGKK